MAQVLVVGSGGREHALCHQFLKSPQVKRVYCAPGNAGMVGDGISTLAIAEDDFAGLISFAQAHKIDLTFIGPEDPLSEGIVDAFLKAGLTVFGPTKASAQLESSKSFAKAFMKRHQIPTAQAETFTDFDRALAYVQQHSFPVVLKVDGLAGGKGVTIAPDLERATATLKALYDKNPKQPLVVEDYLTGQEFSFMCLINQDKIVPVPLSQDHKRLSDHDKGPNTGGMGAYSPLPQFSESLRQAAFKQVIQPTVQGMVADGLGCSGVLYAGLMQTAAGVKVIEYNMRFGDPETEVVLPRLESDFYEVVMTLLQNKQPAVKWRKAGFTLGVVLAAQGYPKDPKMDLPLPDMSNLPATIQVTYANVKAQQGALVSNGGRVFMLSTNQASIESCQKVIYDALKHLPLDGFVYRTDIGAKAFLPVL